MPNSVMERVQCVAVMMFTPTLAGHGRQAKKPKLATLTSSVMTAGQYPRIPPISSLGSKSLQSGKKGKKSH